MKPFILKLEDDWRDIEYSKAEYKPHDFQKEFEAKKMFRPKSINGKKKLLKVIVIIETNKNYSELISSTTE
jgi:hypothetical protein